MVLDGELVAVLDHVTLEALHCERLAAPPPACLVDIEKGDLEPSHAHRRAGPGVLEVEG